MSFDWRQWSYDDWNERLLEYCFAAEKPTEEPLERVPATPEELLRVVRDAEADPRDIVAAFVAAVKERIPLNRLSLSGFCLNYHGWTTNSPARPHFFAMLWLTCLVAYGYPDDAGGFHDRVTMVLGRRQRMDFLKRLWSDLADWVNEGGGRMPSRRRLHLPPPDEYRSDIGDSWFLAFPHQHDRRKLRDLLLAADLVGDEPPIAPVIDVLRRSETSFSLAFREDLEHFVEKFVTAGAAAHDSAFWRAVRQEALPPEDHEREEMGAGLALLAYFDEDELVVYLACEASAKLAPMFTSSPLLVETDGMSRYILYEDGAAPGRSSLDAATFEVLEGRVYVPRASHYIRRGVLVFQEVSGGEYRLVGGAQANEADVALVREDLLDAFIRGYGGNALPSRFKGWYEIVGCEITVRRKLPAGLEGVIHLQETMVPPTIRFVGGIRTAEGFLAFPGFLPRVRFEGATTVDVCDTEGHPVGAARLFDPRHFEWEMPDWLSESAPSQWSVRVRWVDDYGIERTSEVDLVLAATQMRYDYKRLTSGSYNVEACTPCEIEVAGDEDVPLGVTTSNFEGHGPDLIELEPQVRYLGPGLGEFSRTAMPGFDWLVLGPKNSPELLLFTGDPVAPTPPASRRCGDRGDLRHWRKAVRNPPRNHRALARLPDNRVVPLSEVPAVELVLKEYQRHNPRDGALPCQHTVDGAEPHRWLGTVPDQRVSYFVDALAALSVRRGGVRYSVLLDLLSSLLEVEFRDNPPLFYDLMRALVEEGAIDVAYAQGWGATYVIARRPAFVAYRVVDRIRAALIGLTPALLAEHVRSAIAARGGQSEEIRPTCKWLPSVLHVECTDPMALLAISKDLNLAEPHWVHWPALGSGGLDLRPDDQALRDGAPHESFVSEARWDWSFAKFVSLRTERGGRAAQCDVDVERRSHKDRCPVYVVLLDGQPWGWTHIRNWALLHAYSLRCGSAPFKAFASAPIVRSLNGGVYLPLPLGRLCAVLGDGPSGPLLGPDSYSVETYQYPIAYTFRERFGHFIPMRSAI